MKTTRLDRKVAEIVMGVSLKPHRDLAMVKVGWKHISCTGTVFELTDGDSVPMPRGELLREPECPHHWNDRYALHVAEFLGERIADEVEAYREEPLPYSSDLRKAWDVVEQMKSKGFSFALTDVPIFSSVQRMPIAKFARSVHPPMDDEKGWWAEGDTPAEAICMAALRAISSS